MLYFIWRVCLSYPILYDVLLHNWCSKLHCRKRLDSWMIKFDWVMCVSVMLIPHIYQKFESMMSAVEISCWQCNLDVAKMLPKQIGNGKYCDWNDAYKNESITSSDCHEFHHPVRPHSSQSDLINLNIAQVVRKQEEQMRIELQITFLAINFWFRKDHDISLDWLSDRNTHTHINDIVLVKCTQVA